MGLLCPHVEGKTRRIGCYICCWAQAYAGTTWLVGSVNRARSRFVHTGSTSLAASLVTRVRRTLKSYSIVYEYERLRYFPARHRSKSGGAKFVYPAVESPALVCCGLCPCHTDCDAVAKNRGPNAGLALMPTVGVIPRRVLPTENPVLDRSLRTLYFLPPYRRTPTGYRQQDSRLRPGAVPGVLGHSKRIGAGVPPRLLSPGNNVGRSVTIITCDAYFWHCTRPLASMSLTVTSANSFVPVLLTTPPLKARVTLSHRHARTSIAAVRAHYCYGMLSIAYTPQAPFSLTLYPMFIPRRPDRVYRGLLTIYTFCVWCCRDPPLFLPDAKVAGCAEIGPDGMLLLDCIDCDQPPLASAMSVLWQVCV